ncbi:haloacid dehalogenase, type II [Rhinocladiella mackenziei CBS 650.93]|uniref:Rhinocladiella mackenziei CBS 650.93 unplaced genomic scaffold supercont1.7, whole genome shotgun sequence n=1 Tax=Rhinocladiella mackenziei CBS 650.93 TaxID=1442369 RepID=A0A0D2I690_9EURO|nr:haloacid dehalogenase, type II [Rhinocladiella mackenziei CBS 650.93]KIX01319.1 haloacid dehalogenase, type II [Rhinocladiella mackenziei CBS 650.93]
MSTTSPPKALLTDVFGTVVDWRKTVTNHLTLSASEALNSSTRSIPDTVRTSASEMSWPTIAQLWRESYYQFTRTYDPANTTTKFKTVDQHHVEALHKILADHALDGLWTDDEVQRISMIWHFLDPWPDSSRGLGILNQKFHTATLSNGNTSLLSDLARHGSLPYTHIISAQDFGAYKPHPSVYWGAAGKLGLTPNECALVAAHLGDLKAARSCGYQTIYIARAKEESWSDEEVAKAKSDGWVDMWIDLNEGSVGFLEVAKRFGLN